MYTQLTFAGLAVLLRRMHLLFVVLGFHGNRRPCTRAVIRGEQIVIKIHRGTTTCGRATLGSAVARRSAFAFLTVHWRTTTSSWACFRCRTAVMLPVRIVWTLFQGNLAATGSVDLLIAKKQSGINVTRHESILNTVNMNTY